MRRGKASRTAQWVTYMRALGHAGLASVRGFTDPTARELLDEGWRRRLAKTEIKLRSGATGARVTAARSGVDLLALRTVVIDRAIDRSKPTQLVILGAGLDGRAWRLPSLSGARVFEVDHPATQAYKRERLGTLKPTALRVDLVPVDFDTDDLDQALARAGQDPRAPTVWVWEGVVMYLTPETVRATLKTIAARSAPGSTLIVNYHTGLRGGLVGLLLRVIGEPNRSAFSRDEMARELAAAGFTVEQDEGVDEWRREYGGSGTEHGAAKVTRIAVARRQV